MDKNVIRRGEIVSDSGKLYSVIGVLGTVMYIQETDAGNKKVDYQLKEIEPLFRKIECEKGLKGSLFWRYLTKGVEEMDSLVMQEIANP